MGDAAVVCARDASGGGNRSGHSNYPGERGARRKRISSWKRFKLAHGMHPLECIRWVLYQAVVSGHDPTTIPWSLKSMEILTGSTQDWHVYILCSRSFNI